MRRKEFLKTVAVTSAYLQAGHLYNRYRDYFNMK